MTITSKQLKESMLDDLKSRGLVEDIYLDKVEEYISLWTLRKKLEKDILDRGVSISDPKKGYVCENRSVSLYAQVSRQMLAIFSALGFKDIALGKYINHNFVDEDEL